MKRLVFNFFSAAICAAFFITGTASAATFTVNNTNDSGDGSLRGAMILASVNNQPDTIVFSPAVFNQLRTITLTSGELFVDADGGNALTIIGPGTQFLTVSGNNASRVLFVGQSANLTLSGINITGGNAIGFNGGVDGEGGGIYTDFDSTLTLNNSTVSGNTAQYSGGGVYTRSGVLNLNNCVITNNQAVENSSGGLQADGVSNLNNVTVANNSALIDGGIGNYGTMTISDSTVRDNTSTYGAGGIANTTAFGALTIENSIIRGNRTNRGSGGGIHNGNGILTVSGSLISQNASSSDPAFLGAGGGIYNNRTATVINSTISENVAAVASGGGIANNFSNTITVINSTISGNRASGGGGITALDDGGVVTLINSTLTNNLATMGAGGGVSTTGALGDGIFYARNSIIAGNRTEGAAEFPDFSGILISRGHNLIGNTEGAEITGTATGNLLDVNARLLPLAGNGGSTPTHALDTGSPARNAGNNCVLMASGCGENEPPAALTTDQRGAGFPRRIGDAVDIGAFEAGTSTAARRTPFDFDGDGRSDIAVFRPADRVWYLNGSQNGFSALNFGLATDKLVPADYDGDGRADIAVYRGGIWYLQQSTNGFSAVSFGLASDIPVPADYDGDGRSDIAVVRQNAQAGGSVWYIMGSQSGVSIVQFGLATDKPVSGDFDGDGKADRAVFRASNGTWHVSGSSQGYFSAQWGLSADKTAPADYDGDGKTDFAVVRQNAQANNSVWYILGSQSGTSITQFGFANDLPAPADFDGDGRSDIAVVRQNAEGSVWHILGSQNGYSATQFGLANDLPLQNSFLR